MLMHYSKALLLIACISFLFTFTAASQHDTVYYTSYNNLVTSRFYFSQKYTTLRIRNNKEDYNLNYSPNTTLNMGVGATYRWATLNLAYGFGFLNTDQNRGKTRYLDLQFHGYGKKIVIDVLGQFYKGFYLYPKGRAAAQREYYKRPDLGVNLIGTSIQYVVNNKRFSFRSSVFQNEWQKKSAGTFLVGFETHIGRINADSTMTPHIISPVAADMNQYKTSFFDVGLNGGYAYTLVIKRNYFVTGAATISFDYGFSNVVDQEGSKHHSGITSNTLFRLGTGYNSERWGVSLVFVNNDVRLAKAADYSFSLHAGNVRLNFIYRFSPGKAGKRILKKVIN